MKKIAIHHRPGSFSDQWIAYCEKKKISYKIVNAFDSDVIQQLGGCDALMWHHHHGHFKDVLAAKNILFSLEHSGVKVFPDFKTGWHFDDKVAQKYLLESIGAPLVPSYVFYNKKRALAWAKQTCFPKVFKLKGGAGAANVRLARTKAEACRFINKSFGRGFSQFDRIGHLKDRYNKFSGGQDSFLGVLKGIARLFILPDFARLQSPEKGYAYFQDFIPNNDFDIRVVVIGAKAMAEKRLVRKNDFRASGSGLYSYEGIDINVVRIAFDVAKRLELQTVAFDFVLDEKSNPLIVEISYGFGTQGISGAPGYWDDRLTWYDEKITPQDWIVESVLTVLGQ